jgi:hypothetical protein
MNHVKLKTTGSSGNAVVHRPPLLPFIDCFDTFGAAAVGFGPYNLVSTPLSSSLLTHSLDGSDVSTNDTTLVLHGATGALLGNLLGDALLVHAAVDLCPCDLTGVLALEEEGGILGGGEAEDLDII